MQSGKVNYSNDELNRLAHEKIFKNEGLYGYWAPLDGTADDHKMKCFATAKEANEAYAVYWDKYHKDNPVGKIPRENWDAHLCYGNYDDGFGVLSVPEYSKCIWAAWKIVEHLNIQPRNISISHSPVNDRWTVMFLSYRDNNNKFHSQMSGIAQDKDVCRAICLAALRYYQLIP